MCTNQDLKTTPDMCGNSGGSSSGMRDGRSGRTRTRSSSGYSSSVGQPATSPSSGTSESRFNQNSESDLKFFLYMYEVKKMRDIYGKVCGALEFILRSRASFNEMNHLHQHETVRSNLEQITHEVPIYIARLEELCDIIDERIGWKEFKFCFKFLTSQVVRIRRRIFCLKIYTT